MFRFYLLFVLIFNNSVYASLDPKTHEGWENVFAQNLSSTIPLFHYGTKSYFLGYHVKLPYLQAAQFCENIHMRLVRIQSSEENERIQKYVQDANKGDNYWTAGSRLLDGKTWIWMTTGEAVDYTKWAPSQPDNEAERCLEVWYFRDKGLLWNDRDCNVNFNFICERDSQEDVYQNDKKLLQWSQIIESPSISPNINLLHFGNKSYYISSYYKGNQFQAAYFCKLIQMQLVTISSEEENSRLHKYIRDTVAGDSFWSSGAKFIDGKSWIWTSTGKHIEYTHWLPGQPDSQSEFCIQLVHQRDNGLFWNDLNCDVELQFICETPTDYVANPRSNNNKWNENKRGGSVDNSRTDGEFDIKGLTDVFLNSLPVTVPLKEIEGQNFYLGKDIALTYFQAAQYCQHYDMELVSITSEKKNYIISSLLQEANNPTFGPSYWTSGILDETNEWYWSAAKIPVLYSNWKSGEPNGERNTGNCLSIDDNVKWFDLPCKESRYFICENVKSNETANVKCDSRPVVNIYVNNNVLSQDGKVVDAESVFSSKNVTPSDTANSHHVSINNNIHVPPSGNTRSSASKIPLIIPRIVE